MNRLRLTFDEVPEFYDSVPPGYPPEFFELIADQLPGQPQVLEVGPGTGQATRGLADAGMVVTAVEPGPNLAAFVAAKFSDTSRVSVINSPFEAARQAV